MTTEPAFSAVALDYDATFTDTAVGHLQRSRVQHFLAQPVAACPTVLEINCGTGADAVWMAQAGGQVLATDISAEMVAVTHEKIKLAGQTKNARAKVCAFSGIADLPEGPFDLIFSNFGGLNCIAPAELQQLEAAIWTKLLPGGQFAAVVMGRFCWWETLYFLLKRNPPQAFRRRSQGAVTARLNAGATVDTWYYSPGQFQQLFPRFSRIDLQPVGFWLPPSYLDPFFAKWPVLLQWLHSLEKHATLPWFARASDHYFILLKKPTP